MRRREEMAALFAQREEQGLSLRALSRRSGIPLGTLSWWNWRLRQEPPPSAAPPTSFVELVPPAVEVAMDVVVVVIEGIEIRVRPGTSVSLLRELIAALRPC